MASNPLELQLRELKDLIIQLNNTVAGQTEMIQLLRKQLEEAQALADKKQEQIDYLTKKLYGSSSEKQKKPIEGQITLEQIYGQMFNEAEYHIDNDPVPEEEDTVVREHTRKKKKTNRDKFKDLPVEEVLVELSPEEQVCSECGTQMVQIGKEYVREELIYIPAVVKRIQYYRATYKCPSCTEGFNPEVEHHFAKAVVPPALIPHGFASESMVAWCMYQKYAMALPLYRQEQNWLQSGIGLSRTTMANWIITCADRYLIHVYRYFQRKLLERKFLMADETRIQVLAEPERRAQTQSFMWAVRSGEDGLPAIITYGYTQTRARYNIEQFLEGYQGGYLQTDGYQGYNNLKGIRRCCCWSHIRRYFLDAVPKGKKEDLSEPAVQGVKYCDKLFMHERYCREKGYSPEQRKDYRLNKSKPVIDAFFLWLDQQDPVKGSRFDTAVKYAQNRKQYLYTYLEDGRCSFSNNLTENSIRPFTVGRKNWLFAATPGGANASAVVYTMVEMAKAHNLNIFNYLTYLLKQRPHENMTEGQLESLAPWSRKAIECCTEK